MTKPTGTGCLPSRSSETFTVTSVAPARLNAVAASRASRFHNYIQKRSGVGTNQHVFERILEARALVIRCGLGIAAQNQAETGM